MRMHARAAGTLTALALLVSGLLTYHIVNAEGSVSRTRIPTCDEVGLCPKGQRTYLIDADKSYSNAVMKYASSKGCRTGRRLKKRAKLSCPAGVTIPTADPERVMRIADAVSDAQINALSVQQGGVTGNGVLVAVLDTGADAQHPELQGKVKMIVNFTTDSIEDTIGHGTHVAGIIAGQGVKDMNDNRVLGVSPGATLIVGKVCNNQGYCLEGDILAGIEWAVAERARVINLSLGGGSFLDHCDSDPLATQVNWASQNGVAVVVASGNGGANGEGVATPGCASTAISVGAVDAADVRPPWSSFGTALDVVAPGVGILSSLPCAAAGTCPSPGYGSWSGTSMATPHVTGLAALLLAAEPSLMPEQLLSVLTSTTKDVGDAGFDPLTGFGRVDSFAALQSLTTPPPGSSSRSMQSHSFSSSSSTQSAAQSSDRSTEAPPSSTTSSSSLTSSSSSSSASSAEPREHPRFLCDALEKFLPEESRACEAPRGGREEKFNEGKGNDHLNKQRNADEKRGRGH